jgi:hypothetical protein
VVGKLDGRTDRSALKLNRNITAGWAARGAVVLLAFANTRLLIDAVGTEGLAAYSIIISLTPWLALLNLGLPITIQNAISISRGKDADYITIRDYSFGTMIVQALLLLPITMLVAYFAHRILLVNYPFVSLGAVIGTHLFIYVTCICQLLAQVMYAERDAFWPNIYPAFAPIWTTVTLATARHLEIEQFNLIILVVAACGAQIEDFLSSKIQFPDHSGATRKLQASDAFRDNGSRHPVS